jgi:error-prone DNA polymerase
MTHSAQSPYAELVTTSAFTFLTGASHPEELVERAAALGLEAIAITDRNSLAGVVRAHAALRELRRQRQRDQDPTPLPNLVIGCRLVLTDSPYDWVVLPTDRAAYGRLCRLLTLGKRRAEKGACLLTRQDLFDGSKGLILIACAPDPLADNAPLEQAQDHLSAWAGAFAGRLFLALTPRYDGHDSRRFSSLAALAARAAVPTVACGDVLMHHGARRRVADILTCIRERLTIDRLGSRALPNSERRLKPPSAMAALFKDYPTALAESCAIARRCTFSLDELRYEYPDEVANGEAAQDRLARLTDQGLRWRYPDGVPPKVAALAQRELDLIGKLGYAPYFLTVHDIVHFARQQEIFCQGRGSAANSVVCFALGVTSIGPETIAMVFERFVSEARDEPPDIDVDFEHERREEVIQHIYSKYGRDHAGLCATVIHFRARAALREVGTAMGLSIDVVTALSSQVWGWSQTGLGEDRLRELGLDPNDPRLQMTMELVQELIGFPRHLSQHVGGFVITRGRLDELCPIENAAMEERTVIEWDKTDIDTLGILKVDVLSLGMLTCLRKAFDLLALHQGRAYTLATLPQGDAKTYDMLCKGDSLGVFQVESRAQMNFLPRMRPRSFYDLVIQVAIVRPGPIQGDMVHPYLRRRRGEEPVVFPSPELREVLGKTLGVPLFQEQAMRIAIVAADFTPEEADRLRRSLAAFRRTGTVNTFRDRFIGGMVAKGYAQDFAERCFSQIEGFGEYGFPESHAASFALLAYASAWLKAHHPAVFACALLNAQPMGFYAPAQIVRDAREHGVTVRPVCINASYWDCALENDGRGGLALRLGFRQIKGLSEEDAAWITSARGNGFPDVESVWRRAGVSARTLERLAEADAFASMDQDRRRALWDAKAIKGPAHLPLFSKVWGGDLGDEPPVTLPTLSEGEQVFEDYLSLRLSLRDHPVRLLRPFLAPSVLTAQALPQQRSGSRATVCGLVITRQRPGTASGVIFLTLEDETGIINIVVWRPIYEAHRRPVINGRFLEVQGRLQQDSGVIHLLAETITDRSPFLSRLPTLTNPESPPPPPSRPHPRAHHPRDQAKALFPSRDFH